MRLLESFMFNFFCISHGLTQGMYINIILKNYDLMITDWPFSTWKRTLAWMLCHPQRSKTSGSRSWFSQTRRIGSAPLWTMTPLWLWRRKVITPAQTFQMWRTDSSTPARKIRSRSADSTTFAFFAITGYTQLSEPHWTLKACIKTMISAWTGILLTSRPVPWSSQWKERERTLLALILTSCVTWVRTRSISMWSTPTTCSGCQTTQARW